MKRNNYFLTVLLVMFVWISSCSKEEPVGPTSTDNTKLTKSSGAWTDGNLLPTASAPVSQLPQTNTSAAQFFTNRATFKAECPGQRDAEWFEGSLLPANSVGVVLGSLNTSTNDPNYPAGAIKPGISLRGVGNDQIAVLTVGFAGVPSTVVGPNFFADNLEITFGHDRVNAVGLDLLDPFGASTLNINIFALDGTLIASTTATTGTSVPTFWGVRTTRPIGRICFDDVSPGSSAQLVDNLSADQCSL